MVGISALTLYFFGPFSVEAWCSRYFSEASDLRSILLQMYLEVEVVSDSYKN